MFGWIGRKLFGTKHQRTMNKLQPLVNQVAEFEPALRQLSIEQLRDKTADFRTQIENGKPLDDLLPEAFAVVRAASEKVLGMRHYDVQVIGGIVLHRGMVAEMKTGEGKTLVATLPLYLNALSGKGCHLITVNSYLASRDCEWMGRVYNALGLSTGLIVHGLRNRQRRDAYAADITYGTNSEFGFDFLRDNMKLNLDHMVQRGHNFAIVDEVDSILIDEARTPLIISGPTDNDVQKYYEIDAVIPGMQQDIDYEVDEKLRSVQLTDDGITTAEQRLGIENLFASSNIELLHHVNQALRAHALYKRDRDYMVRDGKVIIIDTFTGRELPGRRWSDGLHQAIEAKEKVEIENENQTLATITYQKYFLKYDKLAGMTGTADTEAEEFKEIYKLDCVVVPTNKEILRKDWEDVIYKDEGSKFRAVCGEIQEMNKAGRPVLVGTLSVEKSEKLALLLRRLKIQHQVLNAKQHDREALVVAQAGLPGAVTISTNMAGRGTDILLGGNPKMLAEVEVGPERPEDPEWKQAYEAALERHTAECEQRKKQVLDNGGLHIIGTERHESRRIDNQLRGRAGRQGDPGSSRFFLSLDDDLLRIFGNERMTNMMERLGLEEDVALEHRWLTRAVENAQEKVEAHHFNIRKNLLEYDEVLSQQREAVYGLRLRILGDADTRQMVVDMAEDVAADIMDEFWPERANAEIDLASLNKALKESFHHEGMALTQRDTGGKRASALGRLSDELVSYYETKEKEIGEDTLRSFEREMLLRVIDAKWKDHLLAMQHLRTGIGLQGYGQRNPLLEYKKEGFQMFRWMEAERDASVVERVFEQLGRASGLSREEVQALEAARKARAEALIRGGSAPRPAGPGGAPAGAPAAPQKRKLGRNDPCWCGSGKKYKKCHGREEFQNG